jgi:hypothetical protein
MNAADQAIEEIRAVRHRISAEHDHDIAKYLAHLREEEKQWQEQIQRGKQLTQKLKAERQGCPEKTEDTLALREEPKR